MTMPDRAALSIGGFTIYWYGVIITGAVLLGYLIARREAGRVGLDGDTMLDMFFYMLPPAIIGARLYYVAFEWDSFRDNLISVLWIHNGGLAIYGGVLGGIAGIALFSRRRHIQIGRLLDMVTPSLVLGQALGRWGNFFNQEAYGAVITDASLRFFPLGVYIEELGEWHYATFFYESAWCFAVFAILMATRRRYTHRGDVLAWYSVLYGMERVVVEGMRTDSLWLGHVRFSQLVSILMIAAVLMLFCVRAPKSGIKRLAPLITGLAACMALLVITRWDGMLVWEIALATCAGGAGVALYNQGREEACYV